MTRLLAFPIFFVALFLGGCTLSLVETIQEEAANPIMGLGWRLEGWSLVGLTGMAALAVVALAGYVAIKGVQ